MNRHLRCAFLGHPVLLFVLLCSAGCGGSKQQTSESPKPTPALQTETTNPPGEPSRADSAQNYVNQGIDALGRKDKTNAALSFGRAVALNPGLEKTVRTLLNESASEVAGGPQYPKQLVTPKSPPVPVAPAPGTPPVPVAPMLPEPAATMPPVPIPAPDVELVQNGSFEEGVNGFDQLGISTLNAGSPDIDHWTVVTGSVDYIAKYWTASEGGRSLDMNGVSPGTVSQVLQTVGGMSYDVHFDLAGNPDRQYQFTKMLQVEAAGQSETFRFGTAGTSRTNMGWNRRIWHFKALGNQTELTFRSLNFDPQPRAAWGPALDNVSVHAARR